MELIGILLSFYIGCILGRILLILGCLTYNTYRVHKKFKRLYKSAKDERIRKDLIIDYSKLNTTIPVDIVRLTFRLDLSFHPDDLLSNDLRHYLYNY